MPVVLLLTQAVKKAAPLFETDIFALVAVADSSMARQDTVYVFEAHGREVVSQRTISSTISDVHFARFDNRHTDGSLHKADGVVFFGFDEVYVCEPGNFDILYEVKTGENVGDCKAIVQEKGIKKIAFRDIDQTIVKIIDMNNNFEEAAFQPFKDKQKPSYLSFCEDVLLNLVGNFTRSCRFNRQ